MEVIKTQEAIDRIYEWTVLERYPVTVYKNLVNKNFSCPECNLEGQYFWQELKTYHLRIYCPRCKIVWTVVNKEKE